MSDKNMHIIADFQIIPIGAGTSLSQHIAECEKILEKFELKIVLHTMGTNIEGEWNEVLAAVKQCHEEMHKKGVQRLMTSLKLSSRIDHQQSIQSRIDSVKRKK